ncbi:low affinity immunoglobulin gamma Fc region receptor II-like [Coregonus clupeaformis]|uniref:low affinity immunoglobulin gamma Fc region receptor II-like n=1 Tax=Coregonus clupeaformis TaxID=59861 RepID=UPI001E1C4774|nr:low affinity immunoglobulin gamma Fc region receptor II-like [Coregonus clupeaformis]
MDVIDSLSRKHEYEISEVKISDSGDYWCLATHIDQKKHSEWSDAVRLTVTERPVTVLTLQPNWPHVFSGETVTLRYLHPSVSLRIRPNRTQHFTSKSLSLSCEEKGNSTGWRLKIYRERGVESGCGSNWGSIAGSTCTIRSTLEKDSGMYWCESASGEYSNAVNITVDAGAVILEKPAYPMTEGDSVTLLCTNRYQETNPNPKVDFYKDGELIRNETTGGMTITAVSKSDEGFYKCKSNEGESPESWVKVRVPPGSIVSISLLFRLLCGLLVVSPFLLVSIILMVKCCRAQVVGVPLFINKRVGDSVELMFEGRLKMNTKNFSLTVRELTLQDSGDFLVTGEGDKGQIGGRTITLKVNEPISKVVIQTDITLLANHSCTVRLVCNVSCYSNLTYT